MKVLKSRECPKCGDPGSLVVCITVGAVNCSSCMEFIRLLTKEEKAILKKNLERFTLKVKEIG